MNGGTCSEPITGEYSCSCVGGYDGNRCEHDIDECASNPCENGGTCTQPSIDTYVCDCTDGYDGDECEKFIGCKSSSCENGGSCVGSVCHCVSGYDGDRCENDIDECASNPCENGGTCTQPSIDMYICDCNGNNSGPRCETESSILCSILDPLFNLHLFSLFIYFACQNYYHMTLTSYFNLQPIMNHEIEVGEDSGSSVAIIATLTSVSSLIIVVVVIFIVMRKRTLRGESENLTDRLLMKDLDLSELEGDKIDERSIELGDPVIIDFFFFFFFFPLIFVIVVVQNFFKLFYLFIFNFFFIIPKTFTLLFDLSIFDTPNKLGSDCEYGDV